MNCQPSFKTASVRVADPALDEFHWPTLEPRPTAPCRRGLEEASTPASLAWLLPLEGEPPPASDEEQTDDPQKSQAGDQQKTDGKAAEQKPEQPRRRVPDCDIVDVGPRRIEARQGQPVDVRDVAFIGSGKAALRPGQAVSSGGRNYAKPLLALLILEIAVMGGLYFNKRYTESQVIVVPATIDGRVIIT